MIQPKEEDIGKRVTYRKEWMTPSDYEFGVITSMNEKYVFVRYGCETQAKATKREDLIWG